MVIITKYIFKRNDEGTKERVITEEGTLSCPICNEQLNMLGWRDRKVIGPEGEKIVLEIRRLRCSGCKKIHHELPDFLVPYKRHCSETIEEIITGEGETTNCEERTIRRIKIWWAALLMYFMGVLGSLTEKTGVEFSEPKKLREVVRAVANAHLWIHTRSVCMAGG
jgi:hypothetical protein